MFRYFFSDYFATGEGRTIVLFITNDAADLEARDLQHEIPDLFRYGFLEIAKDEFLETYSRFVPDAVKSVIENEPEGLFEWHGHFYLNMS